MNVVKHYDLLIDEGNDAFRDPPVLQEYMNKWDGQDFIDSMALDNEKTVLEIGIGTGRIAGKVALHCLRLTELIFLKKQLKEQKSI